MNKTKVKINLIKHIIKNGIKTRNDLSKLKRKVSRQSQIPLFSNVVLLKTYHKLLKSKNIKKSEIIENLLKTKPIRSISGIVNVSVLTKPYPCPGQCIFCPTEKGFPKSYLAGEPAADRAKSLEFDPYLQVQARIKMLQDQGHPTDKIELRIVGGTWSAYPKQYQTWFIARCFAACNAKSHQSRRRTTLKKEQELNTKAKNRIVGLSIETRPNFITQKEILRLRKLGVTLVEMGAQTVFDPILKKNKTGLTIQELARATKLLKNAGFKILYQVMPNLPGSDLEKDLELFKILFQDQHFHPDWLKIYPCLVCKDTQLYQLWKKNKYTPYTQKQLINLFIKIKKILPYYTRLTRVFRDIPSQKIMTGCRTSNLREIIHQQMKKKKIPCNCIRCREVKQAYDPKEKIYFNRQDYNASDGKEIFLSFENKKRTKLFSLLRLRIPYNEPKKTSRASAQANSQVTVTALQNAAIIREIQTFGLQLPISESGRGVTSTTPTIALTISPQHKGLGKKLVKQAEKIAKQEFGIKKMAVISGIGAREYYKKKLGYKLQDTYMTKKL